MTTKSVLIAAAVIGVLAIVIWLTFTPRKGNPSTASKPPVTERANERVAPQPPKLAGPPEIYPDLARTPGAANPDITQDNIRETICNPGWSTKSIRPPASYTGRLKREQIAEWNLTDTDPKDYEEDHFIPLEIGGHPTDPRNLWPEAYEPQPGSRQKDRVENQLHREVCSGEVALGRAQQIIVEDWYACYLNIEEHRLCE